MRVLTGRNFDTVVGEDNIVRKDSKLEGYSKLKPVFDRKYGTITAGNSSPLTDGAAALVVCSEERARELGLKPLGLSARVRLCGGRSRLATPAGARVLGARRRSSARG